MRTLLRATYTALAADQTAWSLPAYALLSVVVENELDAERQRGELAQALSEEKEP